MYIKTWMNKPTAVYIVNGILLSNKDHYTLEKWNGMNKYENNYEKNLDEKNYILYDSFYIKLQQTKVNL